MFQKRQRGLTYWEILVTISILVIALVPAMDAIRAGMAGTAGYDEIVDLHHRIASRLEEVLAEPFADLDAEALALNSPAAPSSYSDPAGGRGRLLVFLARYDGDDADNDADPFTGADPGLVWVRVAAEDAVYALTTLTTR